MAATAHWHVDDIDDALAADFDGSLSGLGMELGTASFNMSDALMALPTLSSLKQETIKENGDTSQSSDSRLHSSEEVVVHSRTLPSTMGPISVGLHHGKKNRLPHGPDDDVTGAIKRFCVSNEREIVNISPHSASYYGRTPGLPLFTSSLSCAMPDTHTNDPTSRCRHSTSAPDLRTAVQQSSPTSSTSSSMANNSMLSQMLQLSSPSPPPMPSISLAIRDCYSLIGNGHFQYVLGAATSIATKVNEETMTYLNQGQSYEIKLKKLGDLTEMRGKKLKSIIRVGFQERRLQYMEKEQIIQWQSQRKGDRIVEIDVPLSYGVYDVINNPQTINLSEFLWDPTKETGVFVRVNCISTEFTPKKHGGEKGVPFRIQIETYSYGEDPTKRQHVASCQVKVFKPKGADRKHKTDREKMGKRQQCEQEKYQPSYDCTVFSECTMDSLYLASTPVIAATSTTSSSNSSGNFSPQSSTTDIHTMTQPSTTTQPSTPTTSAPSICSSSGSSTVSIASSDKPVMTSASSTTDVKSDPVATEVQAQTISTFRPMSSEATASEAAQWLQKHRFDPFVKTFTNFSGADILRLTRDDLIQICGLADGIRLYNALHSKAIRPLLTIYVCLGSEQVFRAVYLENLTVSEFASKLCTFLGVSTKPSALLQKIFLQGPMGIKVLVSDEVVQNMHDETMYILDIIKDHDSFRILLKTYTPQ